MKKQFISVIACSLAVFGAKAQVYLDPNASPEERAASLVSELTLDEKISLMRYESAAVPRLGIEQYNWWNEALHGVARAGDATVYPQPIGMAASFDDRLIFDIFTAVSDEARAKHHKAKAEGPLEIYQGLTFWTPNINIFRDPRWGRGHETYGEDPYLTSLMGMAVVRGLQGDNFEGGAYSGPNARKHYKLHACAKHFAVHSGPEWNRHSFNAKDISQRDMWETYLPAFHALVTKAGVKEVMCAYNRYEDEPCCGSNRLLHQILRDEWGYDGLVVSDCWAIRDFYSPGCHETDSTAQSASAKAVITGTDLECGSSYKSLDKAVEEGLITEDKINLSLIRLMTARYQLGEMDPDSLVEWASIPMSEVYSPEHTALASKIARESMVLLKNDGILPLNRTMKIGLVGPNANDSVMQWGNYNGFPASTSTMLTALQERLPQDNLVFIDGLSLTSDTVNGQPIDIENIVASLRGCDVIIYAGGLSPRLEGEEMKVDVPGFRGGDREIIELPEIQTRVIAALSSSGIPVVYVNFSGSAVAFTNEADMVNAVLQAWYPGQDGGNAIADVLMGDYNPSGRLPITFYKSTADLPDFQDYNMTGRTYRYFKGEPLYPFGYGLSYTVYEYGDAAVDRDGDDVVVSFPVTNKGAVDGTEVVQLYLSRPEDAEGPVRQLRAFSRVDIPAGQTVDVSLRLTPEQMEWFDPANDFVEYLPGNYVIEYGHSSSPAELKSISINY